MPESDTAAAQCVFCLDRRHLHPSQVLRRGDRLYTCAPRGQLVGGFLAIAPFHCVGCLAHLPAAAIREARTLQRHIREFYEAAYGARGWTFYEQGRAGGGARLDPAGRFPLHAHLCSLPIHVALQTYLTERFTAMPIPDIACLPDVAAGRPYLYVETAAGSVVYLPSSPRQWAEIERARLKPVIARLLGVEGLGDWRSHPGDHELDTLRERWWQHWHTRI